MIGTDKLLSKTKYDITLQRFFHNILAWALKIVLILLVVSTLGIDITAFAAIIAAAGLARFSFARFALQFCWWSSYNGIQAL